MHIWQDTHSLLHSCMKCTQWGTHGQEIHTTAHIEVKYTALCKSSTWGYNNSPRLVGEKQTGAHDVLSRVSLSP